MGIREPNGYPRNTKITCLNNTEIITHAFNILKPIPLREPCSGLENKRVDVNASWGWKENVDPHPHQYRKLNILGYRRYCFLTK